MQPNRSAEAFSSLNHKLSQLPETETQWSIYRVHKELCAVNEKAYEPNTVAVGPYHHGKDNLRMMEGQKLHILQLLLKRQKQNVERYISAINELEQMARDCYAEPISLSGAEFVEMLVLDGCFIIELARNNKGTNPIFQTDNKGTNPIFQTEWIKNALVRDLILFENQIPFFVLCKLFDLIEGENKHKELIGNLVKFCKDSTVFPIRSEMKPPQVSQDIKHLLDLVYHSWLSSSNGFYLSIEGDESSRRSNEQHSHPSAIELNIEGDEASRHSNEQYSRPSAIEEGDEASCHLNEKYFIPSAIELKGANVEFKKKQGNTSLEVKFENGKMEMSPFIIQDQTDCFLRNLIAYEQYFPRGRCNLVTDYVTLLDHLINSSRDVEILSKCEIIENLLGDSEVAANVINRLGDSVVYSSHFAYGKMVAGANKHHKKPWNRWMAMLRRDIFNSPFAYLSFFAALLLLVLTTVQTVFSILQVVKPS